MKKLLISLAIVVASTTAMGAATYKFGKVTDKTNKEQFISELMSRMTLEEKAQQCDLSLAVGNIAANSGSSKNVVQHIINGTGGVFGGAGAEFNRPYQKIAVEQSRLGIPLIFGYDCIHGMQTDFPIPLASACSWDMQAIERAERVAASEAGVQGVNWVFSPMLDVARDARWGRIAEGAGEDPFLGAAVARARVKGFQGEDLSLPTTVATCVKHYVAYGAGESGRDYAAADMSEARLREVYLPPYYAALVESGAASVMSAFQAYNGVPATCNPHLLRDILKGEYGFKGFVVSDYNAVEEQIKHGVAADSTDAARVAMQGGLDMDMKSDIYSRFLVDEVRAGRLDEALIDDACRRILGVKFDLGLFQDPYRYIDPKREKAEVLSQAHRDEARDMARRSIVLLKNNDNLLPISSSVKNVALIGEMGDNKPNMMGCWAVAGVGNACVTIREGLVSALPNANINFAKGYNAGEALDATTQQQAIDAAKNADVVIMCMGEWADLSGEGRSYTDISIKQHQIDLFRRVKALGKQVIVLLNNGRPLAIPEIAREADAVVETWWLGTEAGNAIADVLLGKYNPSGKLTTSFPSATGMEPFYYNQAPTGRPYFEDHNDKYRSKFQDVPFEAVYPFGYGLSYTTFAYSNLQLSSNTMTADGSITASIDVANTGNREGEEVVQMYINDPVALSSRPMLELKGFEKISLKPGEKRTVSFTIKPELLKYWLDGRGWNVEKGDFNVMIGPNSVDLQRATFKLQ